MKSFKGKDRRTDWCTNTLTCTVHLCREEWAERDTLILLHYSIKCYSEQIQCSWTTWYGTTKVALTNTQYPSIFTSSLDSVNFFIFALCHLWKAKAGSGHWRGLESLRRQLGFSRLEASTQSCSDVANIFLTALSCHSLLQTLENSQTYRILLEIS